MDLVNINSRFRVIGVDPSADNMGIAILDLDLSNNKIHLIDAHTVYGKFFLKQRAGLLDTHMARFVKLNGHLDNFKTIFEVFKPHSVVVETPYLDKYVHAYASLVECLNILRTAAIHYDETLRVDGVEPSKAKASIGVPGNTGDKELMRSAITKLIQNGTIQCSTNVNIGTLSEHAVDAVAMAYWKITQPIFV